MKIVKEIDLTQEMTCVNFFNYIKNLLSGLSDDEYIKIIVKGYAETFTMIEWLKSLGHHISEVVDSDDKKVIIVR